jgi:bacillithiol system protein YtxJ
MVSLRLSKNKRGAIMSLQKITTMQDLDLSLQQKNTVLLLKNSTTCPISHEAFNEFEKLANDLEGETLYYLNVQEARQLSNEIAERFSIKHESPQVLLIKDGVVLWDASHWKITYKTLKELM